MKESEAKTEQLEEISQDGHKYYLPVSTYKNLYGHQQYALKWLLTLFYKKEGCLLCDEMGLGKTITVISFLSCIHWTLNQFNKEPHTHTLQSFSLTNSSHLLITPVTIMNQWKSELLTWEPTFFNSENVWILHESTDMGTRERTIQKAARTRGVLIASYELVRIHESLFFGYNWNYIILDEGQKIKNPSAQVTHACQSLNGLNRIVLTGTPIQNNVKELWSLFDFACPGFLGDLKTFVKDFCGQIIRGSMKTAKAEERDAAHRCTCVLRNLIVPRILRRTRKEIWSTGTNLTLPSKKEYVLYCSMGKVQESLYKDYVNFKSLKTVLSNCYHSYNEGLLAGITHLRKLVNHPYILFSTNPKKFLFVKEIYGKSYEYKKFNDEVKKELSFNSEYLDEIIDNKEEESESLIKKKIQAKITAKHWELSFKFVMLKKMLKGWKKEGHKALIFAQTRRLLDVIEEFLLNENNYTHLRLDGQTPVKQRMQLIDKFNNDPSIDVFLLTTKVGGVGINLIGATRVLIFEPDWNPMSDAQAKDRAVRIGQFKDVVIYRLILANCIEEKIYHRQVFKEFLARKVLKDPFLEKSFAYNDLYDFFNRGIDKTHPPATLIQKRRIDCERNNVAGICLKKKYVEEFEKEVNEVKKLEEKPKKKTVRQQEQEVFANVFSRDIDTQPNEILIRNKIAEKVLSKFERSRMRRATELRHTIELGVCINPLEEPVDKDQVINEQIKQELTEFIGERKVKTGEIVDYFEKQYTQSQFLEFKATLQHVAEVSLKTHMWSMKISEGPSF